MATITAASTSQADVSTAMSTAVDGDTVAIPAGSSSWTTQLSVSKRLAIQGAGIGQTIITDGRADVTTYPRIFIWSVPNTGLSTMSGIEWRGGVSDVNNGGVIFISGTGNLNFRIHHCKFVPNGTATMRLFDIYGLLDHNIFDVSAGNGYGFYYSATDGSNFGDTSWLTASSVGTSTSLYVEDNQFINDQSSIAMQYGHDGWNGSRIVSRFNYYKNCYWANHGTAEPGRWRSMRQFETYQNKWELFDSAAPPSVIGPRGGTGMVFNNTVTKFDSAFIGNLFTLDYKRSYENHLPWGIVTGSNNWDGNTSGDGYPCLDQIGRGVGDGISPATGVQDPGTPRWPNQVADPVYAWGLRVQGAQSFIYATGLSIYAAERDYYEEDQTFDGTTGVGVGTIASRPSSGLTVGVGYWATDQGNWRTTYSSIDTGHTEGDPFPADTSGKFYRVTGSSTWTASYNLTPDSGEPYIYPHPLTSGTATPPTPSASISLPPTSLLFRSGLRAY